MTKPLYDLIGVDYDVTRRADDEIARRLYNHLQMFELDKPVIDIACGSGNYTVALRNLGMKMDGVDVSGQMIKQATEKDSAISWYISDVNKLPFQDGLYYGASCVNAIHHFAELLHPFKEVYRILQDGSRFVIFTSTPEQMRRYWLNEYFPEMMNQSILQMKKVEDIRHALTSSGFSVVGFETFMVQPSLQDFFLYSGKYRPEMYFSPQVREGISSFASLSTEQEIAIGLTNLERDLKDGSFQAKCLAYTSELGDYLYIVAQKPNHF